MSQTGSLKNVLLQKSCFIPTLVVSDCVKNAQNPDFCPYINSRVHMAQFVLRLPFLLLRWFFSSSSSNGTLMPVDISDRMIFHHVNIIKLYNNYDRRLLQIHIKKVSFNQWPKSSFRNMFSLFIDFLQNKED